MRERTDVIGVEVHRLFVAALAGTQLGFESLRLVVGVVELAEGVGQLAPVDEELEAIDIRRIGIVAASQRGDLPRELGDKDRCRFCSVRGAV